MGAPIGVVEIHLRAKRTTYGLGLGAKGVLVFCEALLALNITKGPTQ